MKCLKTLFRAKGLKLIFRFRFPETIFRVMVSGSFDQNISFNKSILASHWFFPPSWSFFLYYLKFCFLNSVPFCVRTKINVSLQMKSFSRVTVGQAFPGFLWSHHGLVSRLSGFLRVPLGSWFFSFSKVPLRSH